MKILLASDNYIFQTDGIANVVISFARDFRARGHDVRVMAPSDRMKSFKKDGDYFIRSVPALYYPGLRLSFNFHDELIKELADWKPDIIHLHTEGAMAHVVDQFLKVCPVPVVMTAHTNYSHYLFGKYRELPPVKAAAAILGSPLYRRADVLIAPSEKVRSFPYVAPVADRIRVIPNGIDLNKWKKTVSSEERAELFERYHLKDNGCTLVIVCRVSKEKNIQEILRLLPRLINKQPEIQLLIVGDGPYRKKLEAICKEKMLTDHVRFTGMIPPDRVYQYYAMGDVFVSASTFEVHSLAYLEAMACGLPMVVREDDSIKGVIEHGRNGFIYRTGREFCRSVIKILRSRGLRESMHRESLLTVEEFTEEKCVERTLALYEEVLQNHSGQMNDETG